MYVGDIQTNDDGELVESCSDASQLSLIHDAKLSSLFNSNIYKRRYNRDLVFASNRIFNQCENITYQNQSPHSGRPWCNSLPSSFQHKKTNWDKFSVDLDTSIKDLPASPANYDVFVERM